MNKCEVPTREELSEIMKIQEVKDAWGLEEDDTPEFFGGAVYAAKFAGYATDGPGYSGTVYVLLGGDLIPPMLIVERNGKLAAILKEGD